MAEASIKFEGKAAKKMLSDLQSNVKEISDRSRAYLTAISAVVFADVIDHFEQERGPESRWQAWSKVYAEAMARRGRGGNKILQDTGRLRNSFKPNQYRKTGDGVLWYNNARTKNGFPYAFAHDEGGPILPQRSFMWLSDKAMTRIEKITAEWAIKVR